MTTYTLPEKDRVASLDVDSQYTFTPACPNELPVPDGEAIVDELNAQAQFACLRLGSKDAHSEKALWVANESQPVLSPVQGENIDVAWPVHAVPGTRGFDLIDGLPKVTDYDFFIWKGVELDMHPYGSCFHDLSETMSTGVIEFLRSHNITHVIVGGLATDYCVKATALQLKAAGFAVLLNLAACRGVSPDTTDTAIKQMQQAGIDIVQNVSEIVQT